MEGIAKGLTFIHDGYGRDVHAIMPAVAKLSRLVRQLCAAGPAQGLEWSFRATTELYALLLVRAQAKMLELVGGFDRNDGCAEADFYMRMRGNMDDCLALLDKLIGIQDRLAASYCKYRHVLKIVNKRDEPDFD